MLPIILSGGSGTRLWPLSRRTKPKQFLSLLNERTLFQETVLRLKHLGLNRFYVVCHHEQRFVIGEQLQHIHGVNCESIILEPVPRSTAPAIAAVALTALEKLEVDPILLVLPADHIIDDLEDFKSALEKAQKLAEKDYIVTFGVNPTHPNTGYGYIKQGNEISNGAYKISTFNEKPDLKTAKKFIENGNYLWNSGIFCIKASVYLEELNVYAPEIIKNVENALRQENSDFTYLEEELFGACENISIDHAIMEQTQKGVVIEFQSDWSDIGDWNAVWELYDKDSSGNVLIGDVIPKDSQNNLVIGQKRHISLLGVNDLVVIDTGDALLISDKKKSQDIKLLVDDLKNKTRTDLL